MSTTESNKRRHSSAGGDASTQSRHPTESGPAPAVVDKLTTVVVNRSGVAIYIGWGPDGNAAATQDRRELSPAGQDILRVYERARNLRVPVAPYTELIPVQYSYIKLKDLASPAEDYFLVNVLDSKGQGAQYRIGELELLYGIADAGNFFQDTSTTGAMGQHIVPSEAIYTVVAPCFELDDTRTALVILFKPAVNDSPQEATFQHFVLSVLRYLWQNDKKDDAQERKGYYDAVRNYLGAKESQVPLILRMAFKNEETAREKWEALKRWIYKQPETPNQDEETDSLGELGMEQLLALAAVMRDAARTYLDRHSSAGRGPKFSRP
jgi:hypothetical protein